MRIRRWVFVVSCLVSLFFGLSSAASAQSWLNPAWLNRTSVTISNSNGFTLTNFQVKVPLDSSFDFAHAQGNGADLRVTASDGVTTIPFWIADWRPGSSTATVWVQIPSIPAAGTTIWLYYGNPAAVSASNGRATFTFFDDFEVSPTSPVGYFSLSAPQTVFVEGGSSQVPVPHTLSVVQANSGGFTYAGYLGQAGCGGIGLTRSSDLTTWQDPVRLTTLPADARWPSVLLVNGVYYMLYEANYCTSSSIALAESTDGINFATVKTIVPNSGLRDQNPDLFFNPNDQRFYIYWFRDTLTGREIRARSASTIEGLSDTSTEVLVQKSTATMAAPNVLFTNGIYFLSTETYDPNGLWATNVFYSTSPTSGFQPVANGLLLSGGNGCIFQTIFNNTLHTFNCTSDGSRWTVTHRTAPLTLTNGLDPTLWTSAGGNWKLVTDTQENGTTGRVLMANLSDTQTLNSTFTGTDYVLESYGRQISGRIWGIGARANSALSSYYSANLYIDLSFTGNLYTFYRFSTGASTLAIAAGGQMQSGNWYNLSMKVHSNEIDVYKDGTLRSQSFDGSLQSGAAALYGETGTVAEFNNVFVRQFAPTDPVATFGSGSQGSGTPPPPPPPGGRVNVAAAASGSSAIASSFFNAGYAPSGAINGDRKGASWSNGGGWNDGNAGVFPDWLEVDFAGPQSIGEVDVFTVQDNYPAPIDPTLSTTFSLYGITDFQVQYWDGSQWLAVPGGSISGNNRVWRQITFSAITTARIRINVTGALNSYSRITEVEAYSALTAAPGPFLKSAPATGSGGQSQGPSVSWAASNGATSYEYCVDTTTNNSCDTSWTAAAGTSAGLSGLSPGTTYWWQVRARNAIGTTDADGGAWWSFTTASGGPVNVAAAASGATASASSSYNAGYGPSGAINGDRKGVNWNNGGGWNDGTQDSFPDALQINFAGAKTIGEIDVFTVQDNYPAPIDPTPTMTFSLYGITDFQVQYWDGAQWQVVPGGSISGNRLVWRKISFPALTTTSIRIVVTGALNSWSRVTEVEAY